MSRINHETVAKLAFETIKSKYDNSGEPNSKDLKLCDYIIGKIQSYFDFAFLTQFQFYRYN